MTERAVCVVGHGRHDVDIDRRTTPSISRGLPGQTDGCFRARIGAALGLASNSWWAASTLRTLPEPFALSHVRVGPRASPQRARPANSRELAGYGDEDRAARARGPTRRIVPAASSSERRLSAFLRRQVVAPMRFLFLLRRLASDLGRNLQASQGGSAIRRGCAVCCPAGATVRPALGNVPMALPGF